MDGNDIIIVIATHKEYRMPLDAMYLPVQVGADGKTSIGYQRDDEGDNISQLNPFFCELTALYWAWKNLDSKYIGLVQYRRHFSRKHVAQSWDSVLRKDDISIYFGKIKAFVPCKRRYWIETLYSHYDHTHHGFQLDETRHIIEELFPDYLGSFDRVCKQRSGYMFNMMILEKEYLNMYAEWLFIILFELKSRLGESGLSQFHSRYYGRISELLFNVWLQNQISLGVITREEIREIPVFFAEKTNWIKKVILFLMAKFLGRKYESSF